MTLAEADAPLGYMEMCHAVEIDMTSAPHLLKYLTGGNRIRETCAAVASGAETLESLFSKAWTSQHTSLSSLDELDDDEFIIKDTGRPSGHSAQTLLYFGGFGISAILDYGATCSGIPEEVAVSITPMLLP